MLGASRKSFLGAVCAAGGAGPAVVTPPAGRLAATCATTVLAVQAGVSLVRVHDVEANRQALEVACRVRAAMPGGLRT
jgi:dihydropteroate synthase